MPKTPEALLTCPDCGTPNFTARGLKSHQGNKNCQQRQAERRVAACDAAPDPSDPSAPSAPADPSDAARVSPLLSIPPSDANFKQALEDAQLEDINDAFSESVRLGQKTRFKALRAELKRRYEESSFGDKVPTWEEMLEQAAQAQQDKKVEEDVKQRAREGNALAISYCVQNGLNFREEPAPAAPDPSAPTDPSDAAALEVIPAPKGKQITQHDLDVLPPVRPAIANPDAEMGAQLTEQYNKATGGMVEVLKFGAMMMRLRDGFSSDSARGVGAKRCSHASRDTGLKAWLKEHAPSVKEGTAYRLLAVAESIGEQYEKIVGAKVAKQFALPALVGTPAADLPPAVAAKQLELFDYVSGTSQRSWLDRFKPIPLKGGNLYERKNGKGARKELSPEEAHEFLHTLLLNTGETIRMAHDMDVYTVATEAELDGIVDHCAALMEKVQAWRKLTKTERSESLAAQILRHLNEGGK